MSRFEPPDRVKNAIRSRYNNECAVCGERTPGTSVVSHLYEDANEQMAPPDALIIQCWTHNGAQQIARYPSTHSISETHDADQIATVGRSQYREANYPRSYACFRLAAYLNEKRSRHTDALENLTEAISSLRPIRWGDFLRATVREAERLCGRYALGAKARWLFLDRLALALFDYGRWRRANDVLLGARLLFERASRSFENPQTFRFDSESSFRREVMIRSLGESSMSLDEVRRMVKRLVEVAAWFRQVGNFDSHTSCLDVAAKVSAELFDDCELSNELCEQALESVNKSKHWWPQQEIRFRQAEFFSSKGKRSNAVEAIVEFARLQNTRPIILEPVFTASGPQCRDILASLKRMNISLEELVERKCGLREILSPVPFEMTDFEIGEVVKVLLKT